MKSFIQAVYNKLDGSTNLSEFKIYAINRPATEQDYPYIIIGIDNDNINMHIQEPTIIIDIYDRGELADTVLDAVTEVMKLLERQELSTDAEHSFCRFDNSGMVPEDDRKVWHWTGDFSVRADKKEYIGGE